MKKDKILCIGPLADQVVDKFSTEYQLVEVDDSSRDEALAARTGGYGRGAEHGMARCGCDPAEDASSAQKRGQTLVGAGDDAVRIDAPGRGSAVGALLGGAAMATPPFSPRMLFRVMFSTPSHTPSGACFP